MIFSLIAEILATHDQAKRYRARLTVAQAIEHERRIAIRIRNANRGRTFKCGPWQWTTWTLSSSPFCHVEHKK